MSAVALIVAGVTVNETDASKLLRAGMMMTRLAALDVPDDAPLAMYTGGMRPDDAGPSWLKDHTVNVDHLKGLDRQLLRWIGNQFRYASRRVALRGTVGEDQRAVNAAAALLHNGALRPEGQAAIREQPADEDLADIRETAERHGH